MISFYLFSRYGLHSVWLFEGHFLLINAMRTQLKWEELLDLEIIGELSAAILSMQCVRGPLLLLTLAFAVLTLVVMKTGPWGKITSPTLFRPELLSGM